MKLKMKFLSILCIFFMIIMSIPVSASDNSITISIDNIENMILNNNIEVKIAENSLKSRIEYYDDLEDDIDKLEKEISDLKESINDNASDDDGNNDKKNEQIKGKKASLLILENQYELKKNDLKISRMTYQNKVKSVVTDAKDKYIRYLNTKSSKDIKKEELKYNKEKNNIIKAKHEMGYISKNEYLTSIIDVVDIQNQYNKLMLDEELSLKELKNILGINDKKVIIDENIEFNIEAISNIDFEEDFDSMISNSRNIKIKKLGIEQAEDKDESNDYEIDSAELELTQEENTSRLIFQQRYDNLIISYNNIRNSINKLNDKEKAFNIMKVKLNHGYVSNKESDEKKLDLINQKIEYMKEKNDLYINYLKYLQMKDGYLN